MLKYKCVTQLKILLEPTRACILHVRLIDATLSLLLYGSWFRRFPSFLRFSVPTRPSLLGFILTLWYSQPMPHKIKTNINRVTWNNLNQISTIPKRPPAITQSNQIEILSKSQLNQNLMSLPLPT